MRQDLCIFSFLGTYFSPTTSSRASMLCVGGVGVGDLPLGCSRVLEKRGRLTLDGGGGKLKERKRRVKSEE